MIDEIYGSMKGCAKSILEGIKLANKEFLKAYCERDGKE